MKGTNMRTLIALLIANEGRPVMTHDELARLRGLSSRTVLREISEDRCPVPMWKDGSIWLCQVADIATWMDRERVALLKARARLGLDFEPSSPE
jgi:hypothetical protein